MIMGRSYLHTTSSELSIHHIISYHNDFSAFDEGMNHFFAYQLFEARVLGVHCYTGIA